jgi:dihydrolipoyl dehydrogenase
MKKETSVDLVIIGAGTAGISAFKEANKITKRILIIDQGPLGTTCARIGCMPSKAFIQAANYFYERHIFAERGIFGADNVKINIPQLMRYVRKMRDDFTSGIIKYIESLDDRFINGKAEIVEPHVIKVDNKRIITKSIIIATGSHSVIPGNWLPFSKQILTSENFFEQNNFEDQMAIIGAGLIGLELGQALKRIGIDITVFHSHDTIGKLTDPEVNKYAVKILQQEYPLYLGQKAQIEKNGDSLTVKGNDIIIKAKKILASLGRKPNLGNIDFTKLGIEVNEIGVPLFDPATMQIKDTSIFIAGDVTKERQLLHEAADEGHIAAYNAVHSAQCFHRRVPITIIFSDPNIAIVGQSYKSLIKNKDFIVGSVCFDHQGRSRIMSKNKGLLRIYAESKKGRLLGAEMIAPAGEYLAHLLAWAIQQNMTVFEILQMPFYHPTVEEGLKTALRELTKQVKNNHKKPSEIVMCDSEAITNWT